MGEGGGGGEKWLDGGHDDRKRPSLHVLRARLRAWYTRRGRRWVLLLVSLLHLLLFVRYWHWLGVTGHGRSSHSGLRGRAGLGGIAGVINGGANELDWRLGDFNAKAAMRAQNLIVVAGHSITAGPALDGVEERDDRWILEDYQEKAGMPDAFVQHIRTGVLLAEQDPNALLVFSGGQTRRSAGPKSEAAAYHQVADHFGWWGLDAATRVRGRAVLEEFSTDSLQNLLFSLCRFREITGSYPAHVTVVSFSFKRERFEAVHRAALRFPRDAFRFVGVDSAASPFLQRLPSLAKWEAKASIGPFRKDPYGCHSALLRRKRVQRNPFMRTAPYALTCPEMSDLLAFCGKSFFPEGRLPWDA